MTVPEWIYKFNIKLTKKDGEDAIRLDKKPTDKQVKELMELKPAIIVELKKRDADEKAKIEAKKLAKEKEREDLKAGRIKLNISYYDGEYLSGYIAHGVSADLLEELELAHYVSGWGVHINSKLIETLGKEITYQQAVEFSRPAREAKEAQIAKANAERQAKFDEAKATGKPVELYRYTDTCNDPREECSLDIITEYAMPDGSIKTKRIHTY